MGKSIRVTLHEKEARLILAILRDEYRKYLRQLGDYKTSEGYKNIVKELGELISKLDQKVDFI